MKILIIRNFPSYMAVKNNTYNIQEVGLAKALVRKGNICDIVLWTDKEEENIEIPVDNVGKVHVFYRHGKTMLKNTVFTSCSELFEEYDILQPCEYNQMQAWYLARKAPNKTVIYHGPYFSEFNKRYNLMCKVFDILFLKSYIRNNSRFIVKSQMAKEFLTNKGIDSKNIIVTGVGIDAQMLSSSERECDEKLYKRMKENTDELKLLYVGKFEERRNIFFLFDVFYKVNQENRKAHLYLVGTGKEDYVKSVFEYADKLGIRQYIIWQEEMEQKCLANIYQMADFFLLSTEYEIFGMVLLEAMYYRTIVLTTRNGGSSTLIENGKNGFIIEERTTEVWANCILENCKNTVAMKQIQSRASDTVVKHFTWDALADMFIDAYEKRLN